MTTTEVLARLCAHWPALGGDDAAARIRLQDWATAVEKFSPDVRAEATQTLIGGWTGDWHPMIPDSLALARQIMVRQDERPAIEAGYDDDLLGSRERVHALIAETAAMLADANRRIKIDGPRKALRLADPPESRRVKPSDLPGGPPWGEPGTTMTPEERHAELDAIGTRKVRTKRVR